MAVMSLGHMSLFLYIAFLFFLISIFIGLEFSALVLKQYYIANKHPEYQSENDHHAIIVAHQKYHFMGLYANGIDILIKHFLINKEPYKIYHCYNSDHFREVLSTRKATMLWIFGHGSRGFIKFGKKEKLYYHEFEGLDIRPKGWITQFHCSHRMEKSLADYIQPQKSFVSNSKRCLLQNRWNIKNILGEKGYFTS